MKDIFSRQGLILLLLQKPNWTRPFPIPNLQQMVIVNQIALQETEMMVRLLFMFEKTYQVNY